MVTYESVAVFEEQKSPGDLMVVREVPLIQVAKVSQVSKDIEEEVTNEITRGAWIYKSSSICLIAGGIICFLASCFLFHRQRTRKNAAEMETNTDFQLILVEFDDL